MRLIRLAALAAICLTAQAATQITDTLYLGNGEKWGGRVEISWESFTASDGTAILKGSKTVTVTAGVFSVALQPNEGATPSGTAYTLRWYGSTARWSETAVVPVSATPVTLAAVRRSSTLVIFPSQLAQTGATNGQCLTWNAASAKWQPGSCAEGAVGTVSSVAGRTGDVVLAISDVTALQTALDGKQPLASTLTAIAAKTLQGTGAKVPLTTGTPAENDCAKFDAEGNITTAGAACGAGGAGVTNHAALSNLSYASAGHTGFEPALGAGNSGQYYRGDKTWQTLDKAAAGLGNVTNDAQLKAASNLSDLPVVATARTNLGLGDSATKNTGAIAGTVAAGDHTHSGYIPTAGAYTDLSSASKIGTGAAQVAAGNHDHAAAYAPIGSGVTNGDTHNHLGGDGAQIAYSSLSGTPTLGNAAAKDTGTSAAQVAAGDHGHSGVYATASHAAQHATGQADAIRPADIGAEPADANLVKKDGSGNITTGNAVLSPTWVLVFPPTPVSSSPHTVATGGDYYCDVAGGCTFTLLPITAAMIGAKFCFFQADGRSGALVLRAPASTTISADGVAGSAAGALTSPAAATDGACVKAFSTTNYKAVTNVAWTPGA